MNRKALIVFNPASGRSRSKNILVEVIAKLTDAGIDSSILETRPRVEPSNYIEREIATAITDVVAIGGDGTLNHVLNGIGNSEVTLNVIPTGTGNDFVKNIDIGNHLREHINTIIHGRDFRIDVGQCNDKLFLNGVGLGFDGQIVSDMLNKKSWLSGHAKYYYFVLKILASFKPVTLGIKLDSYHLEKNLILMTIANGTTFGGGFMLTPEANISDGLLDICLIENISPVKRFLNIHRLNNGTHGKLNEVNFYKTNSIQIETNPLIVGHIDGEYLGHPPFDIKILPAHLKIRVKA